MTGEPYAVWIRREVVDAAGLGETTADMPVPDGTPLACGHSGRQPLGRRVVLPGHQPTNALAAATGFVSTAGDLARFFAQLNPSAATPLLTAASLREMTRAQWRNPHSELERHYGSEGAWHVIWWASRCHDMTRFADAFQFPLERENPFWSMPGAKKSD